MAHMDLSSRGNHDDELHALVEDNNRMLKKLTRALAWSRAWGVIKWLLIVGSTFGVYYYFQDEIQTLMNLNADIWKAVGGARETLQNFNQQLSR